MTAADLPLPGAAPVTEADASLRADAQYRPTQVPAEAKATVTLVPVAAAGLMVSLSLSLLVPVLPRLAAELHTSATSAEWLLTATLLTGAISVPVLGRLGDLYGKKRILVVSLAAFLAGSLICAFTSNIGTLSPGGPSAGCRSRRSPSASAWSGRCCPTGGPAPASR